MPRPRNIERPRTTVRGLFSKRWFVITAPSLLSLTLHLFLALIAGIPRPTYHDEFSYLLAADTFAHFRATNPPHPFWQHFETIHVIHQPTYASKSPPAQGLFMAAGQLLFDQPIVGVWLARALACAAVAWALRASFPRGWALIGGLIAALHPLTLLWSHEYWGGAVPMLGGALALGGMTRILRRPRVLDAILLSLGIALLANSRPYEGLVFTIVVTLVLAIGFLRRRNVRWGGLITRAVLPATLILSLVAAAMLYYNHRVTNDPLKLPYLVHEEQYGLTPLFLFQEPRPTPLYRHKSIENYHVRWALPWYTSQQSVSGFFNVLWNVKLRELLPDYTATGVLAFPIIVALLGLRRNRRLRPIALALLLFSLALLPATWIQSHYVAPAFILILALAVGGLRRISTWPFGRAITAVIALALLVTFSFQAYAILMKSLAPGHYSNQRQDVMDRLLSSGPKHLVFVRYGSDHNVH